jgi:CheY-like chemotaxis protein
MLFPSSLNRTVATKRSAGDLAERVETLRLPDWSLFPARSLCLSTREQVSALFDVLSAVTPHTALRSTADEQPQAPLRVLVVDDQLLYAEAISVLLRQQDGMEVVGIAGDGVEAIEQVFALRPDVVLMDIQMPRLGGISATRWIRSRVPASRVIVMTGLTGDEHVADALGAGAVACIKKFSSAGDLIAAIERLA